MLVGNLENKKIKNMGGKTPPPPPKKP